MILFLVLSQSGCLSNSSSDSITLRVGTESKEFYQQAVNSYLESNTDMPNVIVEGQDISIAASTYSQDPASGSEIFTIPHNNLSQLVRDNRASIRSINDANLLTTIRDNNTTGIYNMVSGRAYDKNGVYAVPYIAQALVFYYNTDHLTETDVLSWNDILVKSKTLSKAAFTLATRTLYDNSFLLLATDQNGFRPFQIYDGATADNVDSAIVNLTSDECLSIVNFGQYLFERNSNGYADTTSWAAALKNEQVLGFIGGAWNYNAAKDALGSKLGITTLPSFTLRSEDLVGSSQIKTYQSGSFYDSKVFVVKKELAPNISFTKIQKLLLYLSSLEMQIESFNSVNNLPIHKDVAESVTFDSTTDQGKLALAQDAMRTLGTPQPFGLSYEYFDRYYNKSVDRLFYYILAKVAEESGSSTFESEAEIKIGMQRIENILKGVTV